MGCLANTPFRRRLQMCHGSWKGFAIASEENRMQESWKQIEIACISFTAHLHWARIPVPVVGIAILAKVKILDSSYSNALGIFLQLLLWSSCRACRGTWRGTMQNATVHATSKGKDFIKTCVSRRTSPPVARQRSSHCKMSRCQILNFYCMWIETTTVQIYTASIQKYSVFLPSPLTFKSLVHFLIFASSSENCIATSLMLGPYLLPVVFIP